MKHAEQKYQRSVDRLLNWMLVHQGTKHKKPRPRKIFTSMSEARMKAGVRKDDSRFDKRLEPWVK